MELGRNMLRSCVPGGYTQKNVFWRREKSSSLYFVYLPLTIKRIKKLSKKKKHPTFYRNFKPR